MWKGQSVSVELIFAADIGNYLWPKNQSLHAFMTPRGVIQPTRTLQGAINSAATFQQKVEPCFAKLHENFKAWIDEFILKTKD